LRYANWQLLYKDVAEAKQTLKYMLNEGLGESCSEWYTRMANVEHKMGNASKVKSVLQKGLNKCPPNEHSVIKDAWEVLLGAAHSAESYDDDACTETIRVDAATHTITDSDPALLAANSGVNAEQSEDTVALVQRPSKTRTKDAPPRPDAVPGQDAAQDEDAPTVFLTTPAATNHQYENDPVHNIAEKSTREKGAARPVRRMRSLGLKGGAGRISSGSGACPHIYTLACCLHSCVVDLQHIIACA